MAHAQRAHHQFHRVGQLLLDHRKALLGLVVDPDIDPAKPHRQRDHDAHRPPG